MLNGDLPGVIRAKGHFWLATRPDRAAEFSLAGALSSVRPLGLWWAALPATRWPKTGQGLEDVQAKWQDPWGDRRQELVFIGSDMDQAALTAALDAALLPASGFQPDHWADLADPFPVWRRQAA